MNRSVDFKRATPFERLPCLLQMPITINITVLGVMATSVADRYRCFG
jgi:hypothetical protein